MVYERRVPVEVGWVFISSVIWFLVCVLRVCARVYVDFRMDLQVPEGAWSPSADCSLKYQLLSANLVCVV